MKKFLLGRVGAVRKKAKHPGESIIAYAHREGCDLIVTGTRAQYTRERMWEESISNYCVWHSWIPVLGKIDQSSPSMIRVLLSVNY